MQQKLLFHQYLIDIHFVHSESIDLQNQNLQNRPQVRVWVFTSACKQEILLIRAAGHRSQALQPEKEGHQDLPCKPFQHSWPSCQARARYDSRTWSCPCCRGAARTAAGASSKAGTRCPRRHRRSNPGRSRSDPVRTVPATAATFEVVGRNFSGRSRSRSSCWTFCSSNF